MLVNGKFKIAALYLAVIFFAFMDRWLKIVALDYEGRFELVGDIFSFELAKNLGVAFSIPIGVNLVVPATGIIILVLVAYCIREVRKGGYFMAIWWLMVVLGAASNLYDRVKYSYVIDYLDLKYYSVFNIADMLILAGIGGLLWFSVDKKE